MENGVNVAEILDLGLSGVLMFLLLRREGRFDALIDRVLGYLEQAKRERHSLRNEVQSLKLAQEKGGGGNNNEQQWPEP